MVARQPLPRLRGSCHEVTEGVFYLLRPRNDRPTTASRSLPVNGEAEASWLRASRFPTCGEAVTK
jgi:hypothetical protein